MKKITLHKKEKNEQKKKRRDEKKNEKNWKWTIKKTKTARKKEESKNERNTKRKKGERKEIIDGLGVHKNKWQHFASLFKIIAPYSDTIWFCYKNLTCLHMVIIHDFDALEATVAGLKLSIDQHL